MQQNHQHYLIIDLEATCSDSHSIPRHEMEIIEIGAVMFELESLNIVNEFQAFVQPVRHPQLTSFCKQLTKIQQSDVDKAWKFPDVLQSMNEWCSQFDDWIFCSWGAYDAKQFVKDCDYHHVAYPFGYPVESTHYNLKLAFSKAHGLRKRMGLRAALEFLELELEGTHHRGIDDARNIARIVSATLQST